MTIAAPNRRRHALPLPAPDTEADTSTRATATLSRWDALPGVIPLRARLLLSLAVALLAFALSYQMLAEREMLAGDFSWPYRGAERLLTGEDPYNDPAYGEGRPYPFQNQLPYPMTAVVTALPFTLVPPYWAGALFFGLGSGLLAFGILARGEWHRLLLFASPSFIIGAMVAQWPPLMMAAAFLPWLQPLAVAKPNLGLPVLLLWLRPRWLVVAAAFALLTLLLDPLWPYYWLRNTEGTGHIPPTLVLPAGLLLLLALRRWRTREGQLLLWLSVAPQFLFFYDQLLLFLLPRTLRQALFLLVVEWVGFELWVRYFQGATMTDAVTSSRLFVVLFFYLPALAIVLRLRNEESETLVTVRQWLARLPLPRRGQPAPADQP